jgi:hypothetical protein
MSFLFGACRRVSGTSRQCVCAPRLTTRCTTGGLRWLIWRVLCAPATQQQPGMRLAAEAAASTMCPAAWRIRPQNTRKLHIPAYTMHQEHLEHPVKWLTRCKGCDWAGMAVMQPAAHACGCRQCLEAAGARYSQALALAPDTPQALNNWGLALQVVVGEQHMSYLVACAGFIQPFVCEPTFVA